MKENRSVGPNLKSYFYYTNSTAEEKLVKGSIVIATGMEGTGALYDEIGEYLDSKGYALYAIDEWGYGKTGSVAKGLKKNWKRNDFHFASYNIHALTTQAAQEHPGCPVYLVGNDFGAMLSLYLLREFPECVDKIITVGWGAPRGQDYGFLLTSYIRKIFRYDNNQAKLAHRSKNKRFAFRFESGEKYAWLSSDSQQIQKMKDSGEMDVAGTVGHYFRYFLNKIRVPYFMRLKSTDRNTPILLMSGTDDLLTMRGRTTKELVRYFKLRKFTNVETMLVPGRHQLFFEKNRFEIVDNILSWIEEGTTSGVIDTDTSNDVEKLAINATKKEEEVEVEVVGNGAVEETKKEETYTSMDIHSGGRARPFATNDMYDINQETTTETDSINKVEDLMEADDDLLIKTNLEK